jgi:hypothetical protein
MCLLSTTVFTVVVAAICCADTYADSGTTKPLFLCLLLSSLTCIARGYVMSFFLKDVGVIHVLFVMVSIVMIIVWMVRRRVTPVYSVVFDSLSCTPSMSSSAVSACL